MNARPGAIAPHQVHDVLHRHMLADGYDLVLDLDRSHGRQLYDSRHDRWLLDMFSAFATLPVGFNHPKLEDPAFQKKLLRAALTNPANSDLYTVELAEFVRAFEHYAMPDYLPHLFLVAGGSLGVENALKAAFDWKVRRNFRKGVKAEKGHQVLHFKEAFHGRSGYTLTLTNTFDPRKYQYFPRFDWPRVSNPKLRFPIDDAEVARVKKAEQQSLDEIKRALHENPDDVAAILIEPVQAEGGDNHFRPEFLRALRQIADESDVMLIFDEVQTGMGLTGRMWAHQHWDVRPDALAFGKKAQVCGMIAGPRFDEEPENVFKTSSRINSTWGGNLVDMVRCQRYLEIMAEEKLVENAAKQGAHLLAGLEQMQADAPELFSSARGLGLMCAIDLPDTATRSAARMRAYELGMLILPCGEKSLRFRPPLDVTREEIDQALEILVEAARHAKVRTA